MYAVARAIDADDEACPCILTYHFALVASWFSANFCCYVRHIAPNKKACIPFLLDFIYSQYKVYRHDQYCSTFTLATRPVLHRIFSCSILCYNAASQLLHTVVWVILAEGVSQHNFLVRLLRMQAEGNDAGMVVVAVGMKANKTSLLRSSSLQKLLRT